MDYRDKFNELMVTDTPLPASDGQPFVSGEGMEVLAQKTLLDPPTLRDTITPMLYGRNREYQGRITARIDKYCKVHRLECPPKSQLEEWIAPYIVGSFAGLNAYIDQTFLWISGERGDHESCFFKMDWTYRLRLTELGAHSLYLVGKTGKALGRILILWDTNGYPVFINPYGVRLFDMAMIVHRALNIDRALQIVEHLDRGLLYVNHVGTLGYSDTVKVQSDDVYCAICGKARCHGRHPCVVCGEPGYRPTLSNGRPQYSKPLCMMHWGEDNVIACSFCGHDHPKDWPYCPVPCPQCKTTLVTQPSTLCTRCTKTCPTCGNKLLYLDEAGQAFCNGCHSFEYVAYKRAFRIKGED